MGGGTSAVYHASKGGIRLLTKATAVQYARDGIPLTAKHRQDLEEVAAELDIETPF